MGFWDTHEVKQGGGYLTPDEKDALIKNEQPFEVTGVRFDPEGKYGARYVVTINLPDPATGENETRMVGFPIGSGVTSRDDILQSMIDDHFGAGETAPIEAQLYKKGNALVLDVPGK